MAPLDRRQFIGAVTAASAASLFSGSTSAPAQAGAKARVVRIRRKDAVDDADNVNAAVVKSMVDQCVARLVGKPTAEEAWKSLFEPDDVVTVKINCLFGPGASTHREVTEAVVAGLLTAGVKADNITVWDRSPQDLAKTGYDLNSGPGVKYTGTEWEAQPTRNGSFNGPLATVINNPNVTALVNVPVLKTHSITGITLAFKNHYGSIRNPGEHHANNGDPYLADLYALPCIKDKTRLIVADALRPVGEGGPSAQPQNTWTYGGILASMDPVAIDAVGARILDEWRAAKQLESVLMKAKYLQTAAKAGLGVADLSQIELIDL